MRQRSLTILVGCALKPIDPPTVRLRPDPAWLREHERLCDKYQRQHLDFIRHLMQIAMHQAQQVSGDGSIRTGMCEVGRWVGVRFYEIGSLSSIQKPLP